MVTTTKFNQTPQRKNSYLFPTLYSPKELIYKFRFMTNAIKSSILHFQLRNLLHAPTKNDIYYSKDNAIHHWSPLSKSTHPILDLSKSDLKISTFVSKNSHLLVGGFGGDFAYYANGDLHTGVLSTDVNGIINYMDIHDTVACISSNDGKTRDLDLSSLKVINEFTYPFPVNCTAMAPDGKLNCVVGDCRDGVVVNSRTGDVLFTLKGHQDYSFACAWSDNANIIATGNQDCTTRLYDTRNLKNSFMTLPTTISAVRSIRFSNDNTTLAVAESGDYIHLYDLNTLSTTLKRDTRESKGYSIWNEECSEYEENVLPCSEYDVLPMNDRYEGGDEITPEYGGKWVNVYREKSDDDEEYIPGKEVEEEEEVYQSQVIDFIGEIAGISFTPDSQSLYISVADTVENPIGCIFEYERK